MEGVKSISKAQIRAIWAIIKRHGVTEEQLHEGIYRWYGVESLKELTWEEASCYIDALKEQLEPPVYVDGMATPKQREYIWGLAGKLGMDEPKRLRALLRARFKVDDVAFLTQDNARKVIEGMKAMVAREKKKDKEEETEAK